MDILLMNFGVGDGSRTVGIKTARLFFPLSAFSPHQDQHHQNGGIRWLKIRMIEIPSFVETYLMSSVITSCNRLMRVVVGLSMGMQDGRGKKVTNS